MLFDAPPALHSDDRNASTVPTLRRRRSALLSLLELLSLSLPSAKPLMESSLLEVAPAAPSPSAPIGAIAIAAVGTPAAAAAACEKKRTG